MESQERERQERLEKQKYYTNCVIQPEGKEGVLFVLPIVQLTSAIAETEKQSLYSAAVNTCQTKTAFTGVAFNNSCPNRSYIDELKAYRNYINSQNHNKKATMINFIDDLISIFVLESDNKARDGDIENAIYPVNDGLKSLHNDEISNKNGLISMNFVGYSDTDFFDVSTDEDINILSRFIFGTGVNWTNFNTCGDKSLKTLVDARDRETMCSRLNNNFQFDETLFEEAAKKQYYLLHLYQATLYSIMYSKMSETPNNRKTILEKINALANYIKTISFNPKKSADEMINIIITQIIPDVAEAEKNKIIENSKAIAGNIFGLPHATQLLINEFDKNRTYSDGFLGKNNYFYLPLSVVLEKMVMPKIGNEHRKYSKCQKVLAQLKKFEMGLMSETVPLNFSNVKDVTEKRFGLNIRRRDCFVCPLDYNVDVGLSTLIDYKDGVKHVPEDVELSKKMLKVICKKEIDLERVKLKL